MELYVAGGCHEHGRNCFLIIGKEYSILVDCGIIEGEKYPYPYLNQQSISRIKYLFLTHSHKDHSGGVEWLISKGFSGKIISSVETRKQIRFDYANWISLVFNSSTPGKIKLEPGLYVIYGRSGHCTGSLWYHIHFEEKRILFTGDYSEKSNFYRCNKLENIYADMAVLDCGDGNGKFDDKSIKKELYNKLINSINENKTVLMPVPKYGRGLEFLSMLENADESIHIYVDNDLYQQIYDTDKNWHIHKFRKKIGHFETWKKEPSIVFVSDAQMKSEPYQKTADEIIKLGGYIVFSGHIYNNTYADILYNSGNAELYKYSVHMNYNHAREICMNNQFGKVILYHSADKIIDECQLTEKVFVKETLHI